MSKQAQETLSGVTYTFQSCSPDSYLDNFDRFGRGKNTKKYMDWLIKNVVVSPPQIAAEGLDYFNKRNDVGAATELVEAIENFLARPVGQGQGTGASSAEA